MNEYINYLKEKFRLTAFEECINEIENNLSEALKEKPVESKQNLCNYKLQLRNVPRLLARRSFTLTLCAIPTSTATNWWSR